VTRVQNAIIQLYTYQSGRLGPVQCLHPRRRTGWPSNANLYVAAEFGRQATIGAAVFSRSSSIMGRSCSIPAWVRKSRADSFPAVHRRATTRTLSRTSLPPGASSKRRPIQAAASCKKQRVQCAAPGIMGLNSAGGVVALAMCNGLVDEEVRSERGAAARRCCAMRRAPLPTP